MIKHLNLFDDYNYLKYNTLKSLQVHDLLKRLLTVINSSPLFLFVGSSEIFGTAALWPLIHAAALF